MRIPLIFLVVLLLIFSGCVVNVVNGQTQQQQAGGLTKQWVEDAPSDNALQNIDQASALVTLYYATGGETGDSWDVDTDWLSYDVSECLWYNQAEEDTCDEAGKLKEIILKNNGLEGKFRSSIFEKLAEHSALIELDLDGNDITGTLPTQVALLTTLEELNLRSNSIDGKIPTHLGLLHASLESIYFDDNDLTGTLPKSLDQLTLLGDLEFSNNNLVGSIPSTWGDTLVALEYFEVFNNQRLNGTLPSNMFTLPSLQYFSIEFNFFTGSIPTSIGLSSTLVILNLKDNYLVGPIPSELGLLSNTLEELRLDDNRLVGTIPTTLGLLTNVKEIQIDQNSGIIGQIPTQLGNAVLLEELILSQTSITGTVPTELETLTNLFKLDLNETNLVGEIPVGLCAIQELSFECQPKLEGFLCGCGKCDCNAPVPVPVPEVVLSAQEEPQPAPAPAPQQDDGGGGLSVCFSEDMTVLVQGKKEPTKMKDLQIGDAILTSTGDFSTVYAFGHHNPTRPIEFIKIWLDDDNDTPIDPSCPAAEAAQRTLPILRNVRDIPLEISADHLIYTKGHHHHPVRADSLQVGDTLQTIEGPRTILQLELIRRIGIYAPLTKQGTLVVNGIMASSYVSLEKESNHATMMLPRLVGQDMQLSYHDLFHMTAAPYRLFCSLSAMIPNEFLPSFLNNGINADGMPYYVAFGLDVLLWVLEQHWIVQFLVMTIILFVTGLVYFVEMVLTIKPIFLAFGALVMHNLLSTKNKKKQQFV